MDDGPDVAALVEMFRDFAVGARQRAPLYARLADGIAADEELAALLLVAPSTQRQPVLLFACVHALLLGGPDHELARFYPNLTAEPERGDALPAFRCLCAERRDALDALLASRSTQTNEIGRCALLVPVLALLADEVGPLAHVDVGASAGLNLLLDRYGYRYEPGGEVGGPSPVLLECGTRGPLPVPGTLPPIAVRVGLDRTPVDVHDAEATRWLEACVWPDQTDRLARLRAALQLARQADVDVRSGDAVGGAALMADEVADGGHPVITNTWVLNYLTGDGRRAYLDSLEALGARRDLSWVYAESPKLIPELPVPADESHRDKTVLTLVRWRDGERRVDHLAVVHPHGYWMHWRAASDTVRGAER
jgi:hypothetical protein